MNTWGWNSTDEIGWNANDAVGVGVEIIERLRRILVSGTGYLFRNVSGEASLTRETTGSGHLKREIEGEA